MALGTVYGVPGRMAYPEKPQKAAQTGAFGAETSFFDYHKFFQDKINEIYVKVQNGETEPSFQIGARSFTQKEWNQFLEKYDSVQDTVRELMREEQEKKEAERLKKEFLESSETPVR